MSKIIKLAVLASCSMPLVATAAAPVDDDMCYLRKEIVSKTEFSSFEHIRKPHVIKLDNNYYECTVTLRGKTGTQYKTDEGKAAGLSQDAACLAAQESTQMRVLEKVRTVSSSSEMVCDTRPEPVKGPIDVMSVVDPEDERLTAYDKAPKPYYYNKDRMPGVICVARVYNVEEEFRSKFTLKQYLLDVCKYGNTWKVLNKVENSRVDIIK